MLEEHDRIAIGEATIGALGESPEDLTVEGTKLVEAQNTETEAVGDVVAAQVAEGERAGGHGRRRSEVAGEHRTVEDAVGLTSLETRLPDILVVVVLQLADHLEDGVRSDPRRTVTILATQLVEGVDQVVASNGGGSRNRTSLILHGGASDRGGAEQTEGLGGTVTNGEGSVFEVSDALGSDVGNELLDVGSGVLEQLLGHGNVATELEGAQGNATDSGLNSGISAVLTEPREVDARGLDGQVAVGAEGDDRGGGAHRVEVVEEALNVGLKLLGDEEAALGIDARLEDVDDLAVEQRDVALGAEELAERSFVSLGGMSLAAGLALGGGAVGTVTLGLELVLDLAERLLAGDALAELLNVGFQGVILGLFVRVEIAVRLFGGIEEEAHLVDEPRTLVLEV